MAITRLQLYNSALLLCAERSLASLTEEREPRRLLDEVWNSNGIDYCLEQGQWWFAMRAVRIDEDPSVDPGFGYGKGFTVPEDWIATSALCSDEFYRQPLICMAAEPDYWYADVTPIYVKYVSNHADWGADLARWPATFADYAAAYFASRIVGKLGGDKSGQINAIMGKDGHLQRNLMIAKSKAAMTQPTQFPAQGSWSRARMGSRNGYYDRGNSGSLIG